MLKRNDLAKQFELVVQQEIKNHNDAVLATNLSINEFRKDLDAIKNHQDLVNASLASEISVINRKQVQLSEILLQITQKLESHLNDTRVLNERNSHDHQILIEGFERALKENARLQERLIQSEREQAKLRDLMKELANSVAQELDQWNKKFNDDLKRTKKEILSMPSEAQSVKRELEEKIAASTIDAEGLIREVQICKKSAFIVEKKIENLYTLIERLDKRISS